MQIPQGKTANSIINCFIAALLVVSCCANAGKISEIRSIEGITEYRLDNGLQLLLFPDPSKDTITVNVTYRVGSKHENYGETGMAHLLEHLLFKGSKNHPNITKELTDRGAETNGSTWLERTNYYETFKASEKNLNWALSMEADRMVNSFVAQKDLNSEMTVVRNEFERGENSPWRILYQRIYATAFDWHNYGNATIGARSDIENVKIVNLQAFYKKYYQPDNATLIIAGKFEQKTALNIVNKTMGKIKRPRRILPTLYTTDPTQDGERELTLRRSGGEKVVAAAYRIPSGNHKDFAALNVLATVLGDSTSGLLHKNLVEKNLATTIFAWPNQQKDSSLIYFNATVDVEADLKKTEIALLATLEDTSKHPITETQVARAKRKLLKEINLAFNNSQTISIDLSEWIGIGDWRMIFINRDRLETVSLEDVRRAAKKYIISSNRTMGRFIPTRSPKRAIMPKQPDLKKLLAGYKGRKEIAPGEAFDTSLENISERQRKSQNAGLKIATVPIKTRGESVYFELRMGIGNEDSLQYKAHIAELTASMLLKGSQRYSREALQDEFDKLKTEVGFSSDAQGIYVHVETTRKNLSKVINLVHEVLTTPTFPEKEFRLLKSRILSKLKSEKTDPQSLAVDAVFSHLNTYPKGHLFHRPNFTEKISGIESVTRNQLKAFYSDHYGGDDLQIGIVGDFSRRNMEQQLEEVFSDWSNESEYAREARRFQNAETETRVIQTPDKKSAFFIAAKNLNLTLQHRDAPALTIASRILGGGFINSRLASRIRQKEGLSYSIASVLRLHKVDRNAQWFTYAISAPENTEKVHAAFTEEMEKAIRQGFTQEELDAAIEGFLNTAKVKRGSNQRLAKTIRDYFRDGYSFYEEIEMHNKIRNLNLDEVNKVVKKYLTPSTLSVVKAGDF